MFLLKLFVVLVAICAVQSARCKNKMKIINTDFVSDADITVILAAHNNIRKQVSKGKFFDQPKPRRRLPKLTWDEDLAKQAKKHTKNCKFEHTKESSPNYDCVGQNIWRTRSYKTNDTINWNIPVQAWADEVHQFEYPTTAIDDAVIGHYTQVVWDETTNVGCAAIQYMDDKGVESDDDRFVYFAVCNYGTCGNKADTAPYEIDE